MTPEAQAALDTLRVARGDALAPAHRAALDVLARELERLEAERDGALARFESYEPGTMKGQVRAIWALAEHYGHPPVSSKHPVGFLQQFVESIVAQRDAERARGDRLAKALRFYANGDGYLWHGDKRGYIQADDRGAVARAALAEHGSPGSGNPKPEEARP